jgi:molybdopterin converting factor small subunit
LTFWLDDKESEAMQVRVALYGAARVIIGQSRVDVVYDAHFTTLEQIVEKLIGTYPRVRPYLLDEAGRLQFYIRVLINDVRPTPDATLATVLHDGDRLTLLVAVAGGREVQAGLLSSFSEAKNVERISSWFCSPLISFPNW